MSNTTHLNTKKTPKTPDPVITDLNMSIIMSLAEGKTQTQVAKELGVTPGAINHQVRRVEKILELKNNGEIDDPINSQRARLVKRLRKTNTIIGKALNYKDKAVGPDDSGHNNLKLATDTALALNKGLHVLTDKQEHSVKVDPLADQRDKMQARLEAARQFGMEAEFEVLPDDTNKPQTEVKQGLNDPNVKST